MMPNRFWVIDVEGNGGSPPEIIELAMVEVADLALTGVRRHWLVRPSQPISAIASRIHGLTNADVAEAPTMEDIADAILPWIEETPIVGHNVRVEVDILKRALPDWSPGTAVDTLKLAKAVRPGLPSYGLAKLGEALGYAEEAARLSGAGHHAALYDATLTAMIFIGLLETTAPEDRPGLLRDADLLDPKQGTLL